MFDKHNWTIITRGLLKHNGNLFEVDDEEFYDMVNHFIGAHGEKYANKKVEIGIRVTCEVKPLKIPSLKLTWKFWLLHPLSSFNIHQSIKECVEIKKDMDNICGYRL